MKVRAGSVAMLLLLLPAFALSGCGDDEGSGASTTSTRAASEQQGASRADAGATGATSPAHTGPKRKANPKTGSSGGSAAPAPAEPESPPGTSSGPTKNQSKSQSKPKSETEPEGIRYPKSIGRRLAKQARVVCSVLPLDDLVKQYQPKSRSPEDVGEAYAASYPVSVRDAVAAGCAAGVREAQ
jgi:hypothetical protein